MLDANHFDPQTQNWRDHLRWGDIVAFRFPAAFDAPERPARIQPGIILDVNTILDDRYVTIALGSDIGQQSKSSLDFYLLESADLFEAGLKAPTQFNCNRRITVSVNHQGFNLDASGTPIMGHLSGEALERFNDIRAEARARADLASAHWQAKRKSLLTPAPTEPLETLIPDPFMLDLPKHASAQA